MLSINSPLGYSALDYVLKIFREKLSFTLDETKVSFSLLPEISSLKVSARDLSTVGEFVTLQGDAFITYEKADLGNVLPLPLVYKGTYPVEFRIFKSFIKNTYGIILEENEFTLENTIIPNVIDSTVIDVSPNPANGEIVFKALPSSGRWKENSELRVIVLTPTLPIRLNSLISLREPVSLETLTPGGTPKQFG